jgi:hypothetical protein
MAEWISDELGGKGGNDFSVTIAGESLCVGVLARC